MADGHGVNPVELEQRLTRMEGKMDHVIERLEDYIDTHQQWAIREIENNKAVFSERDNKLEARIEKTEARVVDLRTGSAACDTNWKNHHKEHEAISRKERAWDAVMGVAAVVMSVLGKQIVT